MTLSAADIREFLRAHRSVVLAEITAVRGSAPREAGASMLISSNSIAGTIGGGALVHLCIDRARQVIREGLDGSTLDIPLGPEIGQCCGGRVDIALSVVDSARTTTLIEAAELEAAFRQAVADPAVRDRLKTVAYTPDGRSGEDFRKLIDEDIKGYGEVVKAANLKFN